MLCFLTVLRKVISKHSYVSLYILFVEANWVARPGWQAKLSGFRIQRQKELNITINELNAIQNSRTSVERKTIYLGIWPLYIGKSHTKECHIQRLTATFRGLRRPDQQVKPGA